MLKTKDQILFFKQEGDSIVVYCKGERKFDWYLYDRGELITAIDNLRKIIETLPLAEGAKLIDQGITIDTEDFALGITLETELNLEVCNINDNAADDCFDDPSFAIDDKYKSLGRAFQNKQKYHTIICP